MPRQGAVNSNRNTFRKDPVEKSVSKIILTLCHTLTHAHFLKAYEMNLLFIHRLVKYKQFLMDLQLTLVTDSLLAAGMITYCLARTRWLQCLQCATPKMWYFSVLLKIRSPDLLSSYLSRKTIGQRASKLCFETDLCWKLCLNGCIKRGRSPLKC